ncbi:MAG: epoxyqueuosine reductase [Mogibacterium sp.]|nr:epoxyqueuosine reductase [Mogibacterium sp.]
MGTEMCTNEEIIRDCLDLFRNTEGNCVDVPGIGETVLFDEPIFGFASADDGLFETFRRKEVIGANYFGPYEWLPEAKSVVALFLPFSEAVRKSNKEDKTDPSKEWLYARIEGQEFISRYTAAIRNHFEEKGIKACVPALDERFDVKIENTIKDLRPDFHADSRWSERHAAYACGLGTFGLSRGLITEKGMAGRFASVIVSAEFEPTPRKYNGIDDYCIKCGVCAKNCPAKAISLKHGKNNLKCHLHVQKMKKKYSPRYGCGKCQVGVPCEFRSPVQK